MEGLAVLDAILQRLDARDAVMVGCVSTRMRACAFDDSLWLWFCARDFGVTSPVGPDGEPCPSFKATYELWNESFGMYPLPLVRRVKQYWEGIRRWLATNFPEANDTLRKGASEPELNQVEDTLKLKLPMATRLLYRFCDGQDTVPREVSEHRRLAPLGIIGGYEFYDRAVNVHLLPLKQAIGETREFAFGSFKSQRIVVATSYYLEKYFFLDCANGQLYVGTSNVSIDGEALPCVPQALIRPRVDASCDVPQDAFLLWLEEHSRRLHGGMIHMRKFRNARAINLFPEKPPFCSVAVTNGVKIRASTILVPEMSSTGGAVEYYYSYSIRMSLQPEGCLLDGVYYQSCQLYSRHWIIKAGDVVVANVNGEGVIGKYPLLLPNGEEFVYQSCTPLPAPPGFVEGSFTFVPGRLSKPEGRQFQVQVARFNLEVPEYLY